MEIDSHDPKMLRDWAGVSQWALFAKGGSLALSEDERA
ncbi:hypothetical protein NSU_1789 [Novosphingobium pentaromativorans US6-1]|uniref:Uncharacterized protein n=1 Tax=Novosphingobium pentaromativorans US6-1 TaxID=1088721 RepID=G6EBR9_9SPHN|nr:hypothetical protein NSU_1789 [Novosphingobium pentaromativorans US6-1]